MARAHELTKQTGMTVNPIVEDAMRCYAPSRSTVGVGGLIRRGPILVLPANDRSVSREEANHALAASRQREV